MWAIVIIVSLSYAPPCLSLQYAALVKAQAAKTKGVLHRCGHLIGEAAEVSKASVLADVDKASVPGPQVVHADWLLDTLDHWKRHAIIWPDTNDFSLLVYPESHKWLRNLAEHHGWTSADHFAHSTIELDKEFCKLMPQATTYLPIKLTLTRLQCVVFDGHFLHSGKTCVAACSLKT